ncbi:putative Ribosomal protein L3 [Trypanosoma vivax]|nr:putative Ribosomal protein L3 [Trypanosoma vivax]
MSHCKFEHPRHGHLGFLPRKRSRQIRGRARSFPKDDPSQKPHLTSFMVYKAGMTHIVRDVDRPGSKVNKKEVVEPVTILEAPPMVVVGIVGYRQTPVGHKAIGTVWAHHTSVEFRRRFYKNWKQSAQLAFTKRKQFARTKEGRLAEGRMFRAFAKKADIIRVVAHTQLRKLRNNRVGVKRAHVSEIQINGGTVQQKIELAKSLLEKEIRIDSVFQQSEACDVCAGDEGSWLHRCCEALGRRMPSAQNPPWSAQSGVHRRVASCSRDVHCCPCWTTWVPPPHTPQQEDLPDRSRGVDGAQPGYHSVRPHGQDNHSDGWLRWLRYCAQRLRDAEGFCCRASPSCDYPASSHGPSDVAQADGEDHAQVHRHEQQDWARSLPDKEGEEPVVWPAQEGSHPPRGASPQGTCRTCCGAQGKGRRHCAEEVQEVSCGPCECA